MVDTLKIYIDGTVYSLWNSVEIIKDMEAVAGAFNITLDFPEIFKFVDGAPLRIEIADTPIITGYIDGVEPTMEDNSWEIAIQGRDKTGDLVDCSAVTASSEFLNLSFSALAEKLTNPFGIKVISKTTKAKTKIAKVSLQQGSVFEELEREARKIGVFLYPNSAGDLIIDEIGSETLSTRLTLPGNINKVKGRIDTSDRYSEYIVKGQQGSSGSLTGIQQTQVNAKAQDKNVSRYRPLIIVAESSTTSAEAKARCEWEAAIRAGRAEELKITVLGWTNEKAALWEVNKLVSVKIDPLKFEDTLLIKTVAFRYNETDGQVTELTLTHPDAFVPKPVITKKAGKTRLLPVL